MRVRGSKERTRRQSRAVEQMWRQEREVGKGKQGEEGGKAEKGGREGKKSGRREVREKREGGET
jgi:hypothetical protein